jgi:proteasome accessory factor B
MTDATERLVNLALFLAYERGPVTAEECRREVGGYPSGQDHAAFERMFERDKEVLRGAGFVIRVVVGDDGESYELDREATFGTDVELDEDLAAALSCAGAALAADPSFPMRAELRSALAKLGGDLPRPGAGRVTSHLTDEAGDASGELVSALAAAVVSRKTAEFDYVNAGGVAGRRIVEPYGTFLRVGRWYVVGRDTGLDEVRVFSLSRISGLGIESRRPKTPDFEPPAGFDVGDYLLLPFQYGDEDFEAQLLFEPDAAWRAPRLTRGRGALEPTEAGLAWRVDVRDGDRLLRWVIEQGPGIRVEGPLRLRDRLRDALERVERAHVG